jgi:hypothetical protein
VIVRISGEDQYEIAGDDYTELNDLDDAVVAAVEAGDEAKYREAFDALLGYVRSNGTKLADDDLRGSDFIIPPADTEFEEAKVDFTGEGIIPESVVPASE